MSAGQPSEVDLDLLADYVGGALDGTGQEAAVARLIAEDPAWAEAHAWLARASGDVRDVLAEWGAVPAPMPADVIGRLTAAVTAAEPPDVAAAPPHVTAEPSSGSAGPGQRERGARPPNRPDGSPTRPPSRTTGLTTRRRMPRWATPVAVVAALVALAGLGVTYLAGYDRAVVSGTALRDDSAEGGAGAPASATTPPQPLAASSPIRLLATGTEYTRTSLTGQVNALRRADARATAKGSGTNAPEWSGGVPAPGAATDQDGISACVMAIAAAHGRGALRVEWVDSASFEGLPALVAVFVDQTGERWAWVVSPDCGQPQIGAATRYSARVG